VKRALKRKTAIAPKLAVGMRVSVKVGLRRIVGTIVEDRGPIGSGGRRLFAVRAKYDTVFESVCEWPAEDLRVLAPRRAA
jgi:hypothetical protein